MYMFSVTGNITKAEIEVVAGNDFEIVVNGNSQSTYLGSVDEFTPVSYNLPITNFVSGVNSVEIKTNSTAIMHVSGGFVKITYMSGVEYQQPIKYYFPGIDGLINLYDGFYIPGDLNTMSISLHLDTEFKSFLNIGNVTVFSDVTNGEETITLSNSELSALLDYNALSKNTIPLRLGLENTTFVSNGSGTADVVSVTDLSGSMNSGNPPKVDQAIEANQILVDILLNVSGNKAGLIGYDRGALDKWYHRISNNKASLNSKLDDYATGSGTCICCGINRAIQSFQSGTISSRVSQNDDDAEECFSDGDMYMDSSDLEFTQDSSCSGSTQIVGMRFEDIDIPQGAVINSAYIEFETDETDSGTTHITFSGEDVDDAALFTSTDFDITSRAKTDASVTWSNVPAWNTENERHQTPDLTPIIQEITNRTGWAVMNDIVIIVNGSGERTAKSHDGEYEHSPLLVINYYPLWCGNGSIETGEECDDGNNINDDGCSAICEIEAENSVMVLLSDGRANRRCPEQNTGDADDDAIEAACDAQDDYNITVHAVGFGSLSASEEATLQQIAICGDGSYYFAEVGDLAQLYQDIAADIIQATYFEQTIEVIGNIFTKLFSDSYIEFNYNQTVDPFGLTITAENSFDNEYSGTYSIPSDASILETKAISYSGPRWTDYVTINNNTVYNLPSYGNDYLLLGDPHSINIPNSLVLPSNTINVTTGVTPLNSSAGSINNKIIYTISKNATSFSAISSSAEGCIWHIQLEDNSEISASVPSTYSGSDNCYYNVTLPVGVTDRYDINDAFQSAVYNLLLELDLDDPINWKIDIPFTEQDLQISLTEVIGIPFTWSTEVQVRIWY